MTITANTTSDDASLGPGSEISVLVEVVNNNHRILRIVQVKPAGRPEVAKQPNRDECSGSDVEVLPASDLAVDVDPEEKAQVPVTIRMSPNAGAGCQGATFKLPVTVMGRVR
ncbi:MAG: hypothetical protein JXA67_12035 [Micromonosporaceae bacterium]|nr:hypothetical protein [Micromonosporaceae bacterium]